MRFQIPLHCNECLQSSHVSQAVQTSVQDRLTLQDANAKLRALHFSKSLQEDQKESFLRDCLAISAWDVPQNHLNVFERC